MVCQWIFGWKQTPIFSLEEWLLKEENILTLEGRSKIGFVGSLSDLDHYENMDGVLIRTVYMSRCTGLQLLLHTQVRIKISHCWWLSAFIKVQVMELNVFGWWKSWNLFDSKVGRELKVFSSWRWRRRWLHAEVYLRSRPHEWMLILRFCSFYFVISVWDHWYNSFVARPPPTCRLCRQFSFAL